MVREEFEEEGPIFRPEGQPLTSKLGPYANVGGRLGVEMNREMKKENGEKTSHSRLIHGISLLSRPC